MKLATLKLVEVMSRAMMTPAVERTGAGEDGDGRGEVAELGEQDAEDQDEREDEDLGEVGEGLLLLLVGSAVLDANDLGRLSASTAACTRLMAEPRSEPSRRPVTTMSRCRFSRRISCWRGSADVARAPRVERLAGGGVEDGVLDGVERGAAGLGQANADGIGAAVGDQRAWGIGRLRRWRWRRWRCPRS
jgi:hypothetical protein